MMGPGGSVLETSTLTSLRRSVMSGVVAKTADGSEIGAYDGSMFYLFDGESLRLKGRYMVNGCPNSLNNVLRASGQRGEWMVGKAGSEICVFSTTLDPMSKPGADGSRAFPVPPTEHNLPIIEKVIAGMSTAMVIDPPRKRLYVATTSPVGLGSIDSDTGLPVDFLSLPPTPISLKMSADGTRLMAGMDGNGRVLVIDVPGWQVAKQLDLSSLLIQPNVLAFAEVGAHAWITRLRAIRIRPRGCNIRWCSSILTTWRRRAGSATRRGTAAYIPALSPDRRYLYAPNADCTLVLEKRDMSTVALGCRSDQRRRQLVVEPGHAGVSPDGARLYTDQGLVYSTSTLRQIGRFPGPGGSKRSRTLRCWRYTEWTRSRSSTGTRCCP